MKYVAISTLQKAMDKGRNQGEIKEIDAKFKKFKTEIEKYVSNLYEKP